MTKNQSYFEEIENKVDWEKVLKKLRIKFKDNIAPSNFCSKTPYKAKCMFCHGKNETLKFCSEGFFTCFRCGRAGSIFNFVSLVFAEKNINTNSTIRTCRWFKKCFNIPLPWEDR